MWSIYNAFWCLIVNEFMKCAYKSWPWPCFHHIPPLPLPLHLQICLSHTHPAPRHAPINWSRITSARQWVGQKPAFSESLLPPQPWLQPEASLPFASLRWRFSVQLWEVRLLAHFAWSSHHKAVSLYVAFLFDFGRNQRLRLERAKHPVPACPSHFTESGQHLSPRSNPSQISSQLLPVHWFQLLPPHWAHHQPPGVMVLFVLQRTTRHQPDPLLHGASCEFRPLS